MKIENINQYSTISAKQSGIYYASGLSDTELKYITTSESKNYKFSKRPEDVIEISVYDAESQNITAWTSFSGSRLSTKLIESSYVDLNGKLTNNSYYLSYSDFFTLKNEEEISVILDPISDIKMFNLDEESSYIVEYTPISNKIGNVTRPISIIDISPSRTEVKLNFSETTDIITKIEFENFIKDKFILNTIAFDVLEQIESTRIEEIYFKLKSSNLLEISVFNDLLSLTDDINIIDFINRIHNGLDDFSIYYQFKNWILRFYAQSVSQEDLINRYYEISRFLVARYLSDEVPNTTTQEYDVVSQFIYKILDGIYIGPINLMVSEYNKQRLEPLKAALNFGNNNMYYILNIKHDNKNIIVKLKSALETPIEIGDTCFISRIISNSALIDYSPFSIPVSELIELRPVDYSKFNYNNYQNSLNNYDITYEQQNRISNTMLELENTKFETDYTEFENFIQFSSAEYRLDIFDKKVNRIETFERENSLLYGVGDIYSVQEISGNLSKIEEIKNSFDGYETFLYNNIEWYSYHTQDYSGSNSASRYDRENPNSLQNNLPEYIRNNTYNLDFIKFVNVIGHYFDTLFIHINQFNESRYPTNYQSDRMFEGAVNKMLSALGWDTSYSSNDIFIELFGEDKYGNIIESKSGNDRKKIIWKRFVNALPYIIKTKGTEECIRILFSVYGVPKTLYKVKEFNSIPVSYSDRDNVFSFDNEYFALHYSGSGEYVQTEWSSDVQSIEFKFSFDIEKIHPEGSVFRFISLGDNWVIGAWRSGVDESTGRMFFTLTEDPNDPNSIKTIVTDNVPIFDGNIYSVLLRKNDIIFDSNYTYTYEVNTSLVPRRFDLIVQRSQNNRTIAYSSASFSFNKDFCNSFSGTTTSSIYIGNYGQVVTSSITPDVDAFYGIIDEVKFYKTSVSDERFESHTKYVDAYDIDDSAELNSSLLLYLNFEKPMDLYYGSSTESLSLGYVGLENSAFSSSIQDIRAYNFPKLISSETTITDDEFCVEYPEAIYYVSASFPWHFRSFRTKEFISVPNFANSSLNSEKIHFSSQSLSNWVFTDISKDSFVDPGVSSPTVGIFFSPTDELNLEILQFFGKINLGNYIGNPTDLYNRTYSDFQSFRRRFFKNFKGVNFNEYIKIIKGYVDSSLFKNISKTIPARSKLKTGILIEPSILERNKIQYRQPTLENITVLDSVIDTQFLTTSNSKSTRDLVGSVDINTSKISSGYFGNLNRGYIKSTGTCIKSNNGVVIVGNKRYFAQIYKTIQKVFTVNSRNDEVYYEKTIEKISYTPLSGSSISEVLSDSDMKFGSGNYRTFLGNCQRRRPRYRRRIGSLSVETIETTMAEPIVEESIPVPQVASSFPETPYMNEAVFVPEKVYTESPILSDGGPVRAPAQEVIMNEAVFIPKKVYTEPPYMNEAVFIPKKVYTEPPYMNEAVFMPTPVNVVSQEVITNEAVEDTSGIFIGVVESDTAYVTIEKTEDNKTITTTHNINDRNDIQQIFDKGDIEFNTNFVVAGNSSRLESYTITRQNNTLIDGIWVLTNGIWITPTTAENTSTAHSSISSLDYDVLPSTNNDSSSPATTTRTDSAIIRAGGSVGIGDLPPNVDP